MNENLHTLLSGSFYIHPMYAMSCLPSIYKSVVDVSYIPKTEANIIASITSKTQHSETSSSSSTVANTVAVIVFNQPVLKYSYGEWLGTQTYMKILDGFLSDPSIAGVVINFDTGGGQVYGTGEFYDYLMSYPKPYVAFTNGYLCSGGYYLAAPAKKIIANKRADAVGSIGAYATIIDTNGIWEHFGAKVHTIYATNSTEKNADYREVIENSNYEPYIKNGLDPTVETFVADMKAARPQLSEEVFNGGTWNGAEAVSLGLIDENGSLQDAINICFELASAQNRNNQNSNTMSKQLPKVQAVLGLDAPLASTEAGSYLNSEQLDSIEAHIEGLETQASTAQQALTTATTAHQTAIDAATGTITTAETSVDAMLSASNLPVTGTLDEKLTALNAHVTTMNGKDGAVHTIVKTDANNTHQKTTTVGGIDVSAALNN
ncbi:S49 family peptidase [Flavobacterium sp. 3HN19-14]|uniref:S49 family peptidase n=1 Tax=Flavobacterium sp. 3HN19-14 TaxID=3448133 RepID=UPI003EE266BA